METGLFALTDTVHDEKSFLGFLVALRKDREQEAAMEQANPSSPYEAGVHGWQNLTIEGFLGSAVAWAEATEQNTEYYSKPPNPWQRAAQIILAGKSYE